MLLYFCLITIDGNKIDSPYCTQTFDLILCSADQTIAITNQYHIQSCIRSYDVLAVMLLLEKIISQAYRQATPLVLRIQIRAWGPRPDTEF
jgi:hypothetical protein